MINTRLLHWKIRNIDLLTSKLDRIYSKVGETEETVTATERVSGAAAWFKTETCIRMGRDKKTVVDVEIVGEDNRSNRKRSALQDACWRCRLYCSIKN